MTNTRQTPYLVLIVLLVWVSLLSTRLLNYDLLFTDEYLSLRTAGAYDGPLTLDGVIQRIITDDRGGMGAMYYLQLHVWEAFTGNSPYAARIFSYLFGILAVAMLYRLGTDLFNRSVGIYSAIVLGSSAFFIDYMHEARAYTEFAFFTTLVMWLYWRIQQLPKLSLRWLVALVVSIGLLLYTHYLALIVGVVLGVYHLLRFRNTRQWWATVVAAIMGGITFLPWIGVTLQVLEKGAGETSRHAVSMTWNEFLPLLVYVFANANVALWALVMWYSLQRLRTEHAHRRIASLNPLMTLRYWLETRPVILLLLWIVIGLTLATLINARIPFMLNLRYLIFVFPALALFTAYGLHAIQQAGIPIRPLVAIWLLTGTFQSFNPTFMGSLFGQIYRAPADGVYQTTAILRQRSTNEDVILVHIVQPGDESFALFPMDQIFDGVPNQRVDQFELMNLSLKRGDNDYLKEAQVVVEGAPFVWTMVVPEIGRTNKSDTVQYLLNTQYVHCERVLERADVVTDLYASIQLETDPDVTWLTPDNQTLGVYALKTQPIDQTWRVILEWRGENVPRGTYSYSLQVVDTNGAVVLTQDHGIPDSRPFACTSDALDMSALPNGNYTLQVVVYNWQTLSPLATKTGNAATLGELERK